MSTTVPMFGITFFERASTINDDSRNSYNFKTNSFKVLHGELIDANAIRNTTRYSRGKQFFQKKSLFHQLNHVSKT